MRRAIVLGGLLMLMLVVRDAVFVQLRLFDAVPELVLLAVVAVAMLEGPELATVMGFAGGLLEDLTNTLTPVGLSCLAFVLVGFAVGVAHGYVIRPGRLLGPGLAAAATLSAALAAIFAGALVGQEYLVSGYQFRAALWASVYSAAAFPGVMALVRHALDLAHLGRAPAL